MRPFLSMSSKTGDHVESRRRPARVCGHRLRLDWRTPLPDARLEIVRMTWGVSGGFPGTVCPNQYVWQTPVWSFGPGPPKHKVGRRGDGGTGIVLDPSPVADRPRNAIPRVAVWARNGRRRRRYLPGARPIHVVVARSERVIVKHQLVVVRINVRINDYVTTDAIWV